MQEKLKEILAELELYLTKVETVIEGLDSEPPQKIYNYFIEITESMVELLPLAQFVKYNKLNEDIIRNFAEKGLSKMKENNEFYLIDIIEYEFIPILLEFKKEIKKKVKLYDLSN